MVYICNVMSDMDTVEMDDENNFHEDSSIKNHKLGSLLGG